MYPTIEVHTRQVHPVFCKVKPGEMFVYCNKLYIKINNDVCGTNSICLNEGTSCHFDANASLLSVQECKIEVVVNL